MSEFCCGKPMARVLPMLTVFKNGVRRKMKRCLRVRFQNFSARNWLPQRFKTLVFFPRKK